MLYKGSELIPLANRSKEKRPLPVHLLNDYLCGGLFEGLYVIGADPGMGKSMLCIQFGMEAAMAGYKVLYMSAEMSGSIVGSTHFNNVSGNTCKYIRQFFCVRR